MIKIRAAGWYLAAAVIGALLASPAAARDAAFLEPSAGSGPGNEAIQVEPKGGIDIGETNVNIARRVTIFFVNASGAPVQIEKVSVNGDASVAAEITNDDCSKQGSIAAQSRCSVEVSITPSSPGVWAVETLLTHNGPGRIARAKITGKTSGSGGGGDKRETGLNMNSKEPSPINFGDLEVSDKAARSALMVNDSPDPITIYSIDVIEATNGLQLLDQGCAVDMELKPGETCPITLIWTPTDRGQVSTDLIIRHSGRQGFTVIPIRGNTKVGTETGPGGEKIRKDEPKIGGNGKPVPPPTPAELEKAAAGKATAVPIEVLGAKAMPADAAGALRLIGTVGNKALLLLADDSTKIVGASEMVDVGNEQKVKVMDVTAKSCDLLIDGKKKTLTLGAAANLVSKASEAATSKGKTEGKGSTKSGGTSGSVSGTSSATVPASASGSASGKSSSGSSQ